MRKIKELIIENAKVGQEESTTIYTVSFEIALVTYGSKIETYEEIRKRAIRKYKGDSVSKFAEMGQSGYNINLCSALKITGGNEVNINNKNYSRFRIFLNKIVRFFIK